MKHISLFSFAVLLTVTILMAGVGNAATSVISHGKGIDIVDFDEDVRLVRFIHAAPYVGVVDVWNEKGIVAKNFAYGLVSGYLKSTPDENREITLTRSGTDQVVAELSLAGLDSGGSFTVVVHNMYDTEADEYILNAIVSEDPEITTELKYTYLGLAHTAPDIGTVQFEFEKQGISDVVPWTELAQGDFTGFVTPQTPNVVGIDADFDGVSDVRFEIPELPVSDYVYALVLNDETAVYVFAVLSDGTLVKLTPVENPVQETASVRIIHLASFAPAVDIYLNGETRAVSDLDFAQSVGYVDLPAETYIVNIVPAGSDLKDTVLKTQLTLDKDKSYTVVAHEDKGELALQVTEDRRSSDRIAIKAQVRASHLIDFIGPVDVYAVLPNDFRSILIDDLTYGEPTPYLELAGGGYVIGLDVNQDGSRDLTYKLPTLFPGDVVDLYAAIGGCGNPMIFTATEDGGLFVSEAQELGGGYGNCGGKYDQKTDWISYQDLPDIVIGPLPGDFQPEMLMK
ncbi:MAG TPA: DUF4397 domain-containing protein [bacterium]|nr:DUF4397 domain-containing protein [bacterium]